MYKWAEECTNAWNKENPSRLSGPFDMVTSWNLDKLNIPPSPELPKYEESWKQWNESSTDLGIISVSSQPELQMWRAAGSLPGYICPGGNKRSEINKLVRDIYYYKNQHNPRHSFNCLFIAEPGWGKTYLAQSLAKYFDFEFINFSIAQMASISDLIDSFKLILSTQKRINKRLLIFIDEIDAPLQGNHMLSLFLSPMWDGVFKIEGHTNKLESCMWIFASTKPLNFMRGLPKGRDFLSRINGPTINLEFLLDKEREEINDENSSDENRKNSLIRQLRQNTALRTELVYQGVNLLNRLFGPISYIDEEVLKLFHNIMPTNGIRSLEIFCSKFNDIAMGKILKNNVPNIKDPIIAEQILPLDPDYVEKIFNMRNSTKEERLIRVLFQP